MTGQGWALAIDLGTSFTTAAAANGGAPAIVRIEGTPYYPSVVAFNGASSTLITGPEAVRQSVLSPDIAERAPKRALALGEPVVLGGSALDPAWLVSEVLHQAGNAAQALIGVEQPPAQVVLTHPARWNGEQLARLRRAADLAGFAPAKLTLLAEPVAAAWMYPIPPRPGALVGVVDFGSGALATTLLRSDGNELTIVGPPGGNPRLGGDDFDEALLAHVLALARDRGAELGEGRPAGDGQSLILRAQLREAITAAKERLSDDPHTNIVAAQVAEFRVTRGEFEALISDKVDAAVAALRQTIAAAQAQPAELSGLYLAGGSARIPLVATELGTSLGVRTELSGDPKAIVALGALNSVLRAAPRWTDRLRRPRLLR